MTTTIQIAWAAGVYEGEGAFSNGRIVRVVQKDPWLVHELQRLFGGTVGQHVNRKTGAVYNLWTITGSRARGFLLTIFTFLSPRRRAQILEYPLFFIDDDFQPRAHYEKAKYDRRERSRQEKRIEKAEEKVVNFLSISKGISREEALRIYTNSMKSSS